MRGLAFALLLLSLAANAGLAYLLLGRSEPAPVPKASGRQVVTSAQPLIKTNVVVRRQFFTWSELESPDYQEFIENLRAINCPEQTIRDIVIADVNQLFARRRAMEVITTDHQWWKSEPDLDLIEEAVQKLRDLDQERRNLLASLLGPNWDASSRVSETPQYGTSLTGPVLGEMSSAKKLAVRQVEERATERRAQYLAQQESAGTEPDPSTLANLRAEARQELAQVMNPIELEEYLLRYFDTAVQLRQEMFGVELTPEEFRGLFRIEDPIQQQLSALDPSGNGSSAASRLRSQTDEALKQLLGPERYKVYELNKDSQFQTAKDFAMEFGAAPEAVMPLYEINQATAEETQRILTDTSLSEEEKEAALIETGTIRRKTLQQLLAPDAYQRYIDSITPNAAGAPIDASPVNSDDAP